MASPIHPPFFGTRSHSAVSASPPSQPLTVMPNVGQDQPKAYDPIVLLFTRIFRSLAV